MELIAFNGATLLPVVLMVAIWVGEAIAASPTPADEELRP